MSSEKLTFLSASSLNGTNVVNSQGECLGDLLEVILELRGGRVAYAVLSSNKQILGLGDKLLVIPWQVLKINQAKPEKVILNVGKNFLKNAPGFSKNHWPQTANPAWLSEVYRYYGCTYP